jgi:hypothetical protein
MRRKIILCFGILGCIISSWYFSRANKYYEPITIEFGRANTPRTEVQIEGKTFVLDVDLGSKFSLDLRKDVIEKIEKKKFHGMGNWKIPSGHEYEAPNYIIPKVTLGNLTFKDVIVQQIEDESLINQTIWDRDSPEKKIHPMNIGSIGRPLLQKYNLLIDYCRSRIIVTNDLKKIGEMGYFLHQMQKMPFTIGLMGINVQMNTKWGVKTFSIDTGSSINLIRSSVLEEEGIMSKIGLNEVVSQCTMKGRDLENITFHSYDLTPKLSDIDGILGTPFLNHHILYVDFSNHILYFRKSQRAMGSP